MPAAVGIILDMDGVLVDSAAAHRRAWQRLGEEIGVPFTAEMFQRTFGQRNASILPLWLGEDVLPQRIDELGSHKESLYRDLVRRGAVRVYPRIPALFQELRAAGAGLVIASSGPRANIELLIDVMGASTLLDAVVAAEDVTHGKPHPEVFLRAADRLRLPPRRCAVIEDSVHGIEAARGGGMLAIAVQTSTPSEALIAAGADVLIPEVGHLDVAATLARLRRN
jgi:beta-phosphoglucomutase